MTELLYWKDPYLRKFKARIIEIENNNIILDKTAFYPQSGNQICDIGYLMKGERRYEIENVSKEEEKVHHQVNSKHIDQFNVGDEITGVIDWIHRYGIMRAHSSQHLLSAIIKSKFNLDTTRANILFEEVMLQIEREISETQLKKSMEDLIFITTLERHEFKTQLLLSSDLSRYSQDLRGNIPDEEPVRLVEVPGFDSICCGGTHVKNSTEIGPIFLNEFKKGKDIKYFVGQKAIEKISEFNVDLITKSNALRTPYSDYFEFVKAQSNKLDDLEANYNVVASQLLDYAAKYPDVKIEGCSVGVLKMELDYRFLQKQFKGFPEKYSLVILKPENKVMVISNCEKLKANMILDRLIKVYGGKGGGSPFSAQGALERTPEDVISQVKARFD